jgi:outer membrane protein OmpA-like peptidoglycan-associated protein
MAFNYEKHKNHANGESFWTSYSDLFLGLSSIFLLLYVTTSLRTGTDGLKAQVENQKLSMQVQDLQNQLKMYDSVKKDYLQSQASKDEVQEYTELMDKLTLLQEEAKDEKTRLSQQALENEAKEKALNKYQQMVRNVINANKLAKTKITKRDDIIDEQDTEIESQDQEISQLEKDISQKKNLIAEGERKIEQANQQLAERMQDLKKAFKQNKITQKIYENRLAKLKDEAESKVDQLKDANEEYQKQLVQTQSKVGQLSGELSKTKTVLNQKEGLLQAKEGEVQGLRGALTKAEIENQKKVAQLRGEYENQKAKERAAFEDALRREKVGSAERARREAAYRADAARKEKELGDKIAGLSGEVQGLQGKVSGLSSQLKDTTGQLAKAKEEIDARRAIAQEIKRGFAAKGIKADVDGQTGEVLIDFGKAYFDNDSSKLKEEMKNVLESAMPVYSKSLFSNPKVAQKISSVEVIGFASPTYKGKFVNPNSTKKSDREALKYNMDLSYRRAKSIFNYIVDGNNMQFDHQQDLLPMMKVSGRSFLEVMKVNRNVASEDFCKVNDCKKTQRVIIRFSMDGKK